MEKYTYLLLAVLILIAAGVVLLIRRDLAKEAIRFGVLGGLAGPLSELFYFRDYWRPPALLGMARLSIEDCISGFAITALSFSVYLCIARTKFTEAKYPSRTKLHRSFFIAGVLAMLLLNCRLGINSMFVSSGAFIFISLIMLVMRPDLIRPALWSAVLVTGFMLVVYLFLFDVISPDFWSRYWLLAGTRWAKTMLGNVPLTEMLWYLSWALLASISVPFVDGMGVVSRDETARLSPE